MANHSGIRSGVIWCATRQIQELQLKWQKSLIHPAESKAYMKLYVSSEPG